MLTNNCQTYVKKVLDLLEKIADKVEKDVQVPPNNMENSEHGVHGPVKDLSSVSFPRSDTITIHGFTLSDN
jgi:hypothetical protein